MKSAENSKNYQVFNFKNIVDVDILEVKVLTYILQWHNPSSLSKIFF